MIANMDFLICVISGLFLLATAINAADVGTFSWGTKSGLTLHDFRRTTDQIGYDMSRRVIEGNRG